MAHTLEKKKSGMEAVTYEFPYMRAPTNISSWEKFALFLYNPHTGQLFGRTAKNWAQLILFYTIFFTVLAALFAICMHQMLRTVSNDFPKWQLSESLIGTEPGLTFRPMSTDVKEFSLIVYDPKNADSVKYWTSKIDDFLQGYHDNVKSGVIQNLQTCDFATPPKGGKVCAFEPTLFGPCNKNDGYGYNRTSPCIFIKLNKIYGWKPEPYNDITDLPEDMPDDLMQYIKSRPEIERNQIWLSCKGVEEVDRDNFNSDLDYFPTRGFPAYYYPYTNVPGYMSPVVAVQVKNINKGVVVNIECRAWAKNMIYRKSALNRQGSVFLQIKVE